MADSIATTGKLIFHCTGDTGGIQDPNPQQAVAAAMERDLGTDHAPAFFYHLGDVVYFNGERVNYFPQFYEPYATYTIPIVAIPGNHDGDVAPGSTDVSLSSFVDNFCAIDPHLTPEAEEINRHAMTQPNVYWTFVTPLLTIIGLYTNCPEGGVVENDQAAWLTEELDTADRALPVIVTLHHPPYSVEQIHGGSAAMSAVLDSAFQASGRPADAVLSGHVHNYQRFVRRHQNRQVPYVVSGAGGYHNLHRLRMPDGTAVQTPYRPPDVDATLEAYVDDRYGFLRMTVTRTRIVGEYIAVEKSGAVADSPADSWNLDLASHMVS